MFISEKFKDSGHIRSLILFLLWIVSGVVALIAFRLSIFEEPLLSLFCSHLRLSFKLLDLSCYKLKLERLFKRTMDTMLWLNLDMNKIFLFRDIVHLHAFLYSLEVHCSPVSVGFNRKAPALPSSWRGSQADCFLMFGWTWGVHSSQLLQRGNSLGSLWNLCYECLQFLQPHLWKVTLQVLATDGRWAIVRRTC